MKTPAPGSSGSSTSTVEQAKEQVSDMAGQAQTKIRSAVSDQVDQRSDQASEQIESVADDVRAVSDSLRERNQDMAAQIADRAADYAQQLSDYLRESDADKIMRDVEGYARQQPWAVIAAGLVVGFAASRVLRASAPSSGPNGSTGSSSTRVPPTPTTLPASRPLPGDLSTSTSTLSGLGTTSAGSLAPSGGSTYSTTSTRSTYSTAPSGTSAYPTAPRATTEGSSGVDR